MPSINKTPNIGLNQWMGNEYPKRQDFLDDNAIIDQKVQENTTGVANLTTQVNTHSVENVINDVHGLLTDGKIIQEVGSNANGQYVRFADGTQIIVALVNINTTITTLQSKISPASFNTTDNKSFSFGLPSIGSASQTNSVKDLIIGMSGGAASSYALRNATAGTESSVDVVVFGIGRWKQ